MTTTQTRYISAAETAKSVRQALKATHCDVRFSVRTRHGGRSIEVTWTDGPSEDSVAPVVGRFVGSSFNYMTDSRDYHTIEGPNGPAMTEADYIFTERTLSDEFIAELSSKCVTQLWGDEIAGQRCGTYSNGDGSGVGCGGVFSNNTSFIHPLADRMSGHSEPLACSPLCAARFYGHRLPRVAVSQELFELATDIFDGAWQRGALNDWIAEIYSGRLPLELPDGPAKEVAVALAPEWEGSLVDLFSIAIACTL